MNKILFIVRIILFHIMALLFFITAKIVGFSCMTEFLFVILMVIYEALLIKDIIQKRELNTNTKYNIISILCFLIIIFILSRCLCDPHFIYHNTKLLKELSDYENLLYGWVNNHGLFLEIIDYYLINNVVYFNIVFILLFIYRKINLRNSN